MDRKGKTKLNKNGQALIEYVLIIALVSLTIIGLVDWLGGYIKDAVTRTSCALVDEEYVNEDNVPGEGTCKEK